MLIAEWGKKRPDIVVADFDGDHYGDWRVTGEAFGPGPARGMLPNQMEVTGYVSRGLVNSYYGGDRSTDTLTSPPLLIQRHYINWWADFDLPAWRGKTLLDSLARGKLGLQAIDQTDRIRDTSSSTLSRCARSSISVRNAGGPTIRMGWFTTMASTICSFSRGRMASAGAI